MRWFRHSHTDYILCATFKNISSAGILRKHSFPLSPSSAWLFQVLVEDTRWPFLTASLCGPPPPPHLEAKSEKKAPLSSAIGQPGLLLPSGLHPSALPSCGGVGVEGVGGRGGGSLRYCLLAETKLEILNVKSRTFVLKIVH